MTSPRGLLTDRKSPSHERHARAAIYVANADGRGLRKLATIRAPEDTSAVTVRSASDGASSSSVNVIGNAQALALSPSILAALIRTSSGAHIELRKPLEVEPYRTLSVPRAIAPELTASGRRVVYRTGRTIRMIDAASGRVSVIATAVGNPIGLSIEGHRVAWAENVGSRGRIRAVVLRNGARQ